MYTMSWFMYWFNEIKRCDAAAKAATPDQARWYRRYAFEIEKDLVRVFAQATR